MKIEKFGLVIKKASLHNQMRHLKKLEMYVVVIIGKTQWRCNMASCRMYMKKNVKEVGSCLTYIKIE